MDATPIRLRPVEVTDIPGVFSIYDREVLHGTATFDTVPRTADERRAWLDVHALDRYPAIVAVEPSSAGDAVVGWAAVSPWSPRLAYARSAETSVYVRHDRLRRGLARALMAELMPRARAAGICVLVARITQGNPASLALHQSLGFESAGVMRRIGEKFGRILDVDMLMKHMDLPPHVRAGGS